MDSSNVGMADSMDLDDIPLNSTTTAIRTSHLPQKHDTSDEDESDDSIRPPRVAIRERGGGEGESGERYGKISESASTVRALPAHVLEQLERMQEIEGTTPTTSMRTTAEDTTQSTAASFLVLPTTTSMIARSGSSGPFAYPSMPPSPRLTGADTSALPSPPSSPTDSVSSLPSVTSSFFFSSAAASPRVECDMTLDDRPDEPPHQGDAPEHSTRPSHHHHTNRRRTIRQQRSYQDESSFSSLESSPSSLELLSGTRGHSRTRRGVWTTTRGQHHAGAGRGGGYSDTAGATSGLIIPSLTLPPALKRPTPYGQTLGEVRLLVLARQGHAVQGGRGFLASLLLEDNDDVVEVGEWEDPVDVGVPPEEMDEELVILGQAGAKILRASTDWIEHTDAHGLEKYEPARNVEIVEMPGYDVGSDVVENLKRVVQAPFGMVEEVLNPEAEANSILAGLVGSASTPLFTALILLLPSALQPIDRQIIDALGPHIPIIVLPPSAVPNTNNNSTTSFFPISSTSSFSSVPGSPHLSTLPSSPLVLSSFTPHNAASLRHGLFHSPETISTLRMEAAGRFLRWREVQRVVRGLHPSRPKAVTMKRSVSKGLGQGWKGWDKEKWEMEWMGEFSRDVAVAVKERDAGRVGTKSDAVNIFNEKVEEPAVDHDADDELDVRNDGLEVEFETDHSVSAPRIVAYSAGSHSFDPLHLPSLFVFTVSMLGPLKERLVEMVKRVCMGLVPVAVGRSRRKRRVRPRSSNAEPNDRYSSGAETVSEKDGSGVRMEVRQVQPANGNQTQQWVVVGGMVGVGFCVGVGVGVVAAKSVD